MFVQDQVVMVVSVPWSKNRKRGKRLMKKASLMAILVFDRAQSGESGLGLKVVRRGYSKMKKMSIMQEGRKRAAGGIASTWSCTKSFWFLRPTDELLSFRSCIGRVSSGV